MLIILKQTKEIGKYLSEYDAVRKAQLLYLRSSEDSLNRMGTATNNNTTVSALAWHIAGMNTPHYFIKENYL